jgi:hypothetical protein
VRFFWKQFPGKLDAFTVCRGPILRPMIVVLSVIFVKLDLRYLRVAQVLLLSVILSASATARIVAPLVRAKKSTEA